MGSHISIIKDLLLHEHSKFITNKVVDFVGDDPTKFSALMELFFDDDWLLNQRAGWPMAFIAIDHPQLIEPYKEKLIDNLYHPSHNAVIRNTLRLFQAIKVPVDYEGKMYDLCSKLLLQIKEPVANKIFAMTVMYNIAKPYPELLSELKIILETQLPYEKPGYKSRAKKTIMLIEKHKA